MKNIVILGGGFAGLSAAKVLSTYFSRINKQDFDKYKIILIDQRDYQTFTPLLYEIATTDPQTADYNGLKSLVAYPFSKVLDLDLIDFVKGEIQSVDFGEKIVNLKGGRIAFDYLILALGSEADYYNIPGLEKYSLTLKSFNDAIAIRNSILFKSDMDPSRPVQIVIGGGGPTGVELAGEIREWACHLGAKQRFCSVEVSLVSGSESILAGFDKKVVQKAVLRLESLGVNMINNLLIQSVAEDQVILSDGSVLGYDVFIWTGGVKAADIIDQKQKIKKDPKKGRVFVTELLAGIVNSPEKTEVMENVYVAGDIAFYKDQKTGEVSPMTAKVAIDQGAIAAANLISALKGRNRKFKFKLRRYPYVIPIGGKFAVAKIGRFVLTGVLGWLFKGLVEFNYLISIMPFWTALKIWLKGLYLFTRNDRLG